MDQQGIVIDTLAVDSFIRTNLQQKEEIRNNPYYDIISLEQIDFTKDWDYSLPTIVSGYQYMDNRIKDFSSFNERFVNYYGAYFSEVDFSNICIAGGAIIGTLLRKDWNNDIDIFIYGLTEIQAINRVASLISQLYNSYKKSLQEEKNETEPIHRNTNHSTHPNTPKKKQEVEFAIIRNKNAITLQFGQLQEIQIILRLYVSISEILHGFDLGSVAVGYDSQHVYFTTLGKFSYEYMVNIIDPTRRSTTYEYRLKKYLDRGFRIILPYLDITKLKTKNLQYKILEVASLPYFTFSYGKVRGNVITMDKLLRYGNNDKKEKYDYGDFEIEEHSLFYKNLKSLVHGEKNYGYYHYSAHMDKDILTSPPYISISKIIDYYDGLEKRIYNRGEFNMKIFSSYFSMSLLPQVLTDMFLNVDGKSQLNELIEAQKIEAVDKLRSLKSSDYQLRFLTRNPGTQLSGSFNPIVSNYQDWYGEYLIQTV